MRIDTESCSCVNGVLNYSQLRNKMTAGSTWRTQRPYHVWRGWIQRRRLFSYSQPGRTNTRSSLKTSTELATAHIQMLRKLKLLWNQCARNGSATTRTQTSLVPSTSWTISLRSTHLRSDKWPCVLSCQGSPIRILPQDWSTTGLILNKRRQSTRSSSSSSTRSWRGGERGITKDLSSNWKLQFCSWMKIHMYTATTNNLIWKKIKMPPPRRQSSRNSENLTTRPTKTVPWRTQLNQRTCRERDRSKRLINWQKRELWPRKGFSWMRGLHCQSIPLRPRSSLNASWSGLRNVPQANNKE